MFFMDMDIMFVKFVSFTFITYCFTVCVARNVFTGDDIQLSADVNFISAEAIVTLINKDWGIRLQI